MTKRMEIKSIYHFFGSTQVIIKISDVGKEKYKTSPLQHTVSDYENEVVNLLKIGDLVRCDGIPYSYNRNPPPYGYRWTKASSLHRFYSLRKIKC